MNRIIIFVITLSMVLQISILNAEDIDEDKTYNSDDLSTQYTFTADNFGVTVTNNATLSRAQKLFIFDDAERVGNSITVHSGSTLTTTGNGNTIFTDGAELTITNSGTISTSTNKSKAINISKSDNVSITNNSGGVIRSGGNTILGTTSPGSDNTTIVNSGQIISTNSASASSAIIVSDNDSGTTITNNSGGEITSKGNKGTIIVGVSSTITNSGTIKNKNLDKNAIQLKGNNNTITLKDEGVVIGIIKAASGTTGNTLKLNHGVGKSYYYNTSGDFTLQDLDGNQVVEGSAGSVSQGGSEILDELLGYKSLNIRKSLTKYKSTTNESKSKKGWGEINFASFNRKQNNQSLSLGFNYAGVGINLINPYSKDKDFILSIETSKQNFTKDHTINRYSISSGFYFPNRSLFNNIGNESFLLAGLTLHKSDRQILTNTTASGRLDIKDNYETFELIAGTKINNNYFIPNLGLTFGFSHTPSHLEDNFYEWDAKNIGNISFYFDDDYKFNFGSNNSINLGWILDLRKMVTAKDQDFEINNTRATYKQDDDLTEEVTLAANIGYEKKISDQHFLKFNLDSTTSTQELTSFSGNFSYKFTF